MFREASKAAGSLRDDPVAAQPHPAWICTRRRRKVLDPKRNAIHNPGYCEASADPVRISIDRWGAVAWWLAFGARFSVTAMVRGRHHAAWPGGRVRFCNGGRCLLLRSGSVFQRYSKQQSRGAKKQRRRSLLLPLALRRRRLQIGLRSSMACPGYVREELGTRVELLLADVALSRSQSCVRKRQFPSTPWN